MAGLAVALVSDDPDLSSVVEHVLLRHGVRVVPEAEIVVSVERGAISVIHGGARIPLGYPVFEHALVEMILAPRTHELCVETVQVVIATALGDDQIVELAGLNPSHGEHRTRMVRAAARRVLGDPTAEAMLGRWLGGEPPGCVAVCAWRMTERLDEGDLAGAAALLWSVARVPGAAWRAFEVRARRQIVIAALGRCACREAGSALAAK